MSISPVPMILQVESAEGHPVPKRSPSPAAQPAPPAEKPPDESPSPAIASPHQFNTDMKVDDQHHVYYQFVDIHSGRVLYEIPPQAVREIAESHNVSIVVGSKVHTLDVKT